MQRTFIIQYMHDLIVITAWRRVPASPSRLILNWKCVLVQQRIIHRSRGAERLKHTPANGHSWCEHMGAASNDLFVNRDLAAGVYPYEGAVGTIEWMRCLGWKSCDHLLITCTYLNYYSISCFVMKTKRVCLTEWKSHSAHAPHRAANINIQDQTEHIAESWRPIRSATKGRFTFWRTFRFHGLMIARNRGIAFRERPSSRSSPSFFAVRLRLATAKRTTLAIYSGGLVARGSRKIIFVNVNRGAAGCECGLQL